MKYQVQGWRHALLFVLILGLNIGMTGCDGREEVYMAGVQAQETEEMSDAWAQKTEEMSDAWAQTQDLSEWGGGVAETGSETPYEEYANVGSTATVPLAGGYVYVCGAVNQPGIYPIHEGMRVFEAIELAGGFTLDADCEWLNQAEPLQDGQRLYVYTQEETRSIIESGQGSILWADNTGAAGDIGGVGNIGYGFQPDGQKVNLNTADHERLKTLPGIGDVKADAIIQYREEHGMFNSIEEIQNIPGIKSSVFSKIKDLITV